MLHKIKKYLLRTFIYTAGFFLVLTLLVVVFRGRIERYAIGQLDQFFKVPVYIHDVEFTFWKTFPNFSIRLDGVLIHDYSEEFGKLPDTLLYANRIDLKANTWSLLKADMSIESIEVRDALVGIRVDNMGKENYDIFIHDSTSEKRDLDLNLKRVLFKNTQFTYNNALTEQRHDIAFNRLKFSGHFKNDLFDMHVESNARIDRFKDKSITLLKGLDVELETDILVNTAEKRYQLPKSIFLINQMPFELSFLLESDYLDLELKGAEIKLNEVMGAIHQNDLNKLKNIETKGLVQFILKVYGELNREITPNIEAEFQIANGFIKDPTSGMEIKKIDFQGHYEKLQNKPEKLELSQLTINTMGQKFNGRLAISDFGKPDVRVHGQGGIDLASLHHFFPLPKVKFIQGSVEVDGAIHAIVNNPNLPNQHIQVINSKANFACYDIAVETTLGFPKIEKINGAISTRNDDFVFNRFQVKTAQTSVEMSGNVSRVISYLEQSGSLQVDGAFRAERLDLDEFLNHSSQAESGSSHPVGVFVLPKNILGAVDFDIQKFVINQHVFSDIQGSTKLSDRQIDIKNLKLIHLESTASGTLRISEKIAGTIELIGEMSAKDLNLKQVFAEWNNFEQETIRSENISGKADLSLKFHFPFSMSKGIVKEKINAQASLKIVGGALIQVEALKEIGASMRSNTWVKVFLGKNLDIIEKKLANLTFETLENTFYISNSKFVIPKMLIKTNVMDLTVDGWQHFNETLEYHFQFDFRDLKQQNKDADFGQVVDDGASPRLFLKMFGSLSNLQFAWDADARKQYKKEQREQEKQTFKEVMKTEFGLFKKDSTVQTYKPPSRPQEIIEIDFGDEEEEENVDVEQKKRKIEEKYKRLKKNNSTKTEELIIEFE